MNKRSPSVQEIEELVSFLPQLYAEGFNPIKQWHGGTDDGDGVITIPWPEYDQTVLGFIRVADGQCWTDSNYLSSKPEQMLNNENAIQAADLSAIKTMLTFCVRGERFCDGHWGAMIEGGHIRRLLLRLSELVPASIERDFRIDDDPTNSTPGSFKKKSGIYIVQLKNKVPMPVTRDPRYVESCARVDRTNIKVGKAKDFETRKSNYWKDFGEENVLFEPLAELEDIVAAERAILRALKPHRKLSPKGGKLEWLEGISYEDVKQKVFAALGELGFEYITAQKP